MSDDGFQLIRGGRDDARPTDEDDPLASLADVLADGSADPEVRARAWEEARQIMGEPR